MPFSLPMNDESKFKKKKVKWKKERALQNNELKCAYLFLDLELKFSSYCFFFFNITNIKICLIGNSFLKQCLLEHAW